MDLLLECKRKHLNLYSGGVAGEVKFKRVVVILFCQSAIRVVVI